MLRDGQETEPGQEPSSDASGDAGPGRGRGHHGAVADGGLLGSVGNVNHHGAVAERSGRVPGTDTAGLDHRRLARADRTRADDSRAPVGHELKPSPEPAPSPAATP